MKISNLYVAVWAGAAALALLPVPSTAQGPIDPPVTNCNILPPSTPITTALLKSGLPCTATLIAPFNLDNLQNGFDYYSWLTFLALNSPAAGGVIGKDAPTIWEQWKELEEVILPDGSQPLPWGQSPPPPAACRALIPKGAKIPVLRMVGKTPNVLTQTTQPFDTGPLIDQNGRFVRYEILMNRPMFEYILQHQLYNQQGQAAFGKPMFPPGSVVQGTNGTIGGILIKASWKVLLPSEDKSRFHVANVLIYQPAVPNPPIKESCTKGVVGLVGLHIVHKTTSDPQWLWTTFEHVDNDPTKSAVDGGKLATAYNFYNPKCAAKDCPVNTQPPRPWDPNVIPFPKGFKSQIVRLTDLMDDAKKLNSSFQGIVPSTVWQNYMLVSTQWPANAQSKTDPSGNPAPAFLANTTLETYVQGTIPMSSSSCMHCHVNATDTQANMSDFTYILQNAQKQATPSSGKSKGKE
jgi:hypothetical protein